MGAKWIFRKVKILLSIAFLLSITLISLFPHSLAPYEPQQMFSEILAKPSFTHVCGTDGLGRDIFSLMVYSTRMTFFAGIAIAAVSGTIGIAVGCLAGINGGFIDNIIVEGINLFSIIPSVFIVLLVATTGEITFFQYVLVASVSFWTGTARIMRSQMLTTMELPFVQTLLYLGERKIIVIVKHIIPNAIAPVITNIALTVASACVLECGLSYIGVCGLEYSLGLIMNHGQRYILSAWWITGYPIIVILLICVSILGIVDMVKDSQELS